MARSLIQTYALTVCFSTLMCFVIALGVAMYDLVQIVAPSFTVQDYSGWQSDELFLMYHPDKKSLPEDERAALRQQYREAAVETERRSGWQSLVFASIILAIDVGVYAAHWIIARKAELRGV